MHHDGGGEHFGAAARLGVLQIRADLRQVGPVVETAVIVDAVGTLSDDVLHQDVGETPGERPCGRAGKRAIEVSAVGKVAGLGHEAMDVHDRHSDDRAGEPRGIELGENLADDLDPVDFVAVYGPAEPEPRPIADSVDDFDRQREPCLGGKAGDGKLDAGTQKKLAGSYIEDLEKLERLDRAA